MSALGFRYCFHHVEREAVAQCPSCKRVFCRECITEHDDRIICASCLQRLIRTDVKSTPSRRFSWPILVVPVRVAMAICVGWLCFYTVGRLLLSIPSEFHSGAVWGHAGEVFDEP